MVYYNSTPHMVYYNSTPGTMYNISTHPMVCNQGRKAAAPLRSRPQCPGHLNALQALVAVQLQSAERRELAAIERADAAEGREREALSEARRAVRLDDARKAVEVARRRRRLWWQKGG